MFRKFAIETTMLLLFSWTGNAHVSSSPSVDKPSPEATARFTITFAKSPYADFLFYLLYRNTGQYPDLATAVAITDIPPLDSSSFLPEDSIISGVANYGVLYQLATHHDDAARLGDMLKRVEPRYPEFYSFWQQRVGPDEDKTASLWATQEVEWNPISHLEEMERLKFPFSSIACVGPAGQFDAGAADNLHHAGCPQLGMGYRSRGYSHDGRTQWGELDSAKEWRRRGAIDEGEWGIRL
jgi:hypothetical protein